MEKRCLTYLYIVLKNENDVKEIENELKAITKNYEIKDNNFEIGRNENSNVDINEMLRVTINDFINQESFFKNLKNKYDVNIYLEVVPYLGEDYKPILSIEKDIIKFLYLSEIEFDMDYYIYD